MKRILIALLAVLLLLGCAAFAEEAGEEQPEPTPLPAVATPTDLCAHEHTKIVRYFDAPVYRPLDAENHTVSGRATVQTVCIDCGAILSSSVDNNAEETKPHVFRKGKCSLCGREGGPQQKAVAPATEFVVILEEDEDTPNQYFCTLTGSDLESAADTLVLRPEGCDTALALQTNPLREEIDRTGGTLTAEIEQPAPGDVSASIRLYNGEGEEAVPETREISLRIYSENAGSPLTVSYTDPEGETSREEASWVTPANRDAESYWNVTWLGDGMYSY